MAIMANTPDEENNSNNVQQPPPPPIRAAFLLPPPAQFSILHFPFSICFDTPAGNLP